MADKGGVWAKSKGGKRAFISRAVMDEMDTNPDRIRQNPDNAIAKAQKTKQMIKNVQESFKLRDKAQKLGMTQSEGTNAYLKASKGTTDGNRDYKRAIAERRVLNREAQKRGINTKDVTNNQLRKDIDAARSKEQSQTPRGLRQQAITQRSTLEKIKQKAAPRLGLSRKEMAGQDAIFQRNQGAAERARAVPSGWARQNRIRQLSNQQRMRNQDAANRGISREEREGRVALAEQRGLRQARLATRTPTNRRSNLP